MGYTADKYNAAVKNGILTRKQKDLERKADELLRDAGSISLTTPATLDRERQEVKRHGLIGYEDSDELVLVAPVDTEPDISDADKAIGAYATFTQKRVYTLMRSGLNQRQIAIRLGISQQRVSTILAECRRHVADWLDANRDWEQVLAAEISRRPLPFTDRDEKAQTKAIERVGKTRSLVAAGHDEDGDVLYRLDGKYLLRVDQIHCLATRGAVRTTRYGLIE